MAKMKRTNQKNSEERKKRFALLWRFLQDHHAVAISRWRNGFTSVFFFATYMFCVIYASRHTLEHQQQPT